MKIDVDYEQLAKQYSRLSSLISDYNSKFNALIGELKTYSDWTGQDSKKFQEQAAVLETNLQRMMKNVDTLAEAVKSASERYKDAADIISPNASRI